MTGLAVAERRVEAAPRLADLRARRARPRRVLRPTRSTHRIVRPRRLRPAWLPGFAGICSHCRSKTTCRTCWPSRDESARTAPCIYFGHSYGGVIALGAAIAEPTLCATRRLLRSPAAVDLASERIRVRKWATIPNTKPSSSFDAWSPTARGSDSASTSVNRVDSTVRRC